MLISSRIKTMLSVASFAALSFAVTAPAVAVPVEHDGSIFAASNRVRFSFIHTSTGNGGGGIIGGNLLDNGGQQIVGDVSYTWNSGGVSLGTGTTITFDRGPTTVFDNGTFVMDLWTSPSVLTVGAFNSAAHGTIGGVDVTHDIGGTINFTITQTSGNNVVGVLTDSFFFDENTRMGPINGIGSAGGSPETFNTYLWGETGVFEDNDCDGNCSDIQSTFFATSGTRAFGIDLAFSGTQQVSEPAALALFGIGLIGLGVARRRRAHKTIQD